MKSSCIITTDSKLKSKRKGRIFRYIIVRFPLKFYRNNNIKTAFIYDSY